MSELETYQWYRQFVEHWTEKRLEPLDLTDTEILDWMSEYAPTTKEIPATKTTLSMIEVKCDWITPTRGKTLREAVCLAAAKYKEANS